MPNDTDLCLRARGIAILGIVIHNFIHLLPEVFIGENEMTFSSRMADGMYARVCSLEWSAIGDAFSFFGWYGVAVFVFLSGYGLAQKYGDDWNFRSFLHSVAKVMLLFVPPYVLYEVIRQVVQLPETIPVADSLPLVANFVYPFKFPDPGPYWYLGLAIQLYAAYGIFSRVRSSWFAISVSSVTVLIVMLADPSLTGSVDVLPYMRANFVAWMPLFIVGVVGGRCRSRFARVSNLTLVAGAALSALLLFDFSFQYHLWTLSVFPAVALILCLAALSSGIVSRFFSWLGSCSAAIFVIHPLVRHFFLANLPADSVSVFLWTSAGVFASVATAWPYSVFYRWCKSKLLFFDKIHHVSRETRGE